MMYKTNGNLEMYPNINPQLSLNCAHFEQQSRAVLLKRKPKEREKVLGESDVVFHNR